jgi:prepilin-type processing-associated H-X9-DG protein
MSLLVGVMLSAVQKVRGTLARAECAAHLQQIGLGLNHYHDTHGSFPPGLSYRGGTDPMPFLSWLARILPFIEQEQMWRATVDAFSKDLRFTHDPPHIVRGRVVALFICPADSRVRSPARLGSANVGLTSYLGVSGHNLRSVDGILFLDSKTNSADVTDGLSNTIIVGERPPSTDLVLGWWYAGEGQNRTGSGDSVIGVRELNVDVWGPGCRRGPYQFTPGRTTNQCDAFHFWSPHSGGANFIFCDGSVRFLAYSADAIITALATRAGGEAGQAP